MEQRANKNVEVRRKSTSFIRSRIHLIILQFYKSNFLWDIDFRIFVILIIVSLYLTSMAHWHLKSCSHIFSQYHWYFYLYYFHISRIKISTCNFYWQRISNSSHYYANHVHFEFQFLIVCIWSSLILGLSPKESLQ